MFRLLHFFSRIVFFTYRTKIYRKENLVTNGRTIAICNHLKLTDPIIVFSMFKRQVNFIAKAEMFKIKIIKFFITRIGAFPVERDKNDLKAVKNCLNVLNNDKILGIFPEGTRSKTGELLKFEPGIAVFAIKTKSPIIPIVFHGKYSLFNRAKITVGEKFELSQFYEKKLTPEILNEAINIVRNTMLEIQQQPFGEKV